jgi:hypothetical protein
VAPAIDCGQPKILWYAKSGERVAPLMTSLALVNYQRTMTVIGAVGTLVLPVP